MSGIGDYFQKPVIKEDPPRLAISADGRDKRGKTYWSIMTTPEPIAVVTNDTGTEAVIQKAIKAGRKVSGVFEVMFETPDPKVIAAKNVDKEQEAEWRKVWNRYKEGIYRVMDDKTIRTLVRDTETGLYELVQLATFGKIRSNLRKDLWTELNGEYCKLFWDLYKNRPDLNIILIHKAKKQYGADDKPTGKFERAGHKDVGFQVDLSLNFEWEPILSDFYTEIDRAQPLRYMDNRDNLIGKRWYAAPSDPAESPSHFGYLAMTVFPETEADPGYWGL
jgi:hypothetical protein